MRHPKYIYISTVVFSAFAAPLGFGAANIKNDSFSKPMNKEEAKPSLYLKSQASSVEMSWQGPYAGLNLGYDTGSAKLSTIESGAGFLNAVTNPTAYQGPGVEFVLGWGRTLGKYYLGLEALTSLYKSRVRIIHAHIDGYTGSKSIMQTQIRKSNPFGLALRAGYQIYEKVLLTGKIGATSTRFNLKIAKTLDQNEILPKTIQKRFQGAVLCLGTDIQLTEHFVGRLEVSHIHYGRKRFKITQSHTISFKPQSHEMKVGLISFLK